MGKHRYGVIFDAGSSGTRVYIYRWLSPQLAREQGDANALASLPDIKMLKEKKVHPGISTYGDSPEKVGQGLDELVQYAMKHVPKDEIESTPIFLLATAGMRLLPQIQREAVLQSICSYFKENTRFQLPNCDLHVQVIPGETEGLYGWIAANYLLGGFDAPAPLDQSKDHNTYGFLDMGGASAQIAFAPNTTEAERHANDLKMIRLRRVGGELSEYRVFVTTWLGFGANEARRRYVEQLLETYPGQMELPDPCLPVGLTVTKAGLEIIGETTSKEPRLLGTGQFTECLRRTNPLLGKDKPCVDNPCLLSGIHTPAIDFSVNHFVGVSEFWHTTHEVFANAHKDKAYDFETYQKQVTEFCSRDWKSIQIDVVGHKWGKKVDEKTVEEVCFKASWLINVLHDGIGVPRYGLESTNRPTLSSNQTKQMLDNAKDRGFLNPFQAVDKIKGEEVSWTLGKMVLYASSQVAPSTNTTSLFVGFGSNQPGVPLPSDFERPGGKWDLQNFAADTTTEDQDWDDQIFSGNYSRRVPGILIFLVILILAAYLLCGRERRTIVVHKIRALFGGNFKTGPSRPWRRKGTPGLLSNTLFSSHTEPSYERVLEDADPDDFELQPVSPPLPASNLNAPTINDLYLSESSFLDRPQAGRTSGWATPANRGLSPDFTRSSPKNKGYFDGLHAGHASNSAGLGITPFDRGGLIIRTESRERLTALEARSRSRLGSPTRRSPLPTPLAKASID